MGEIIDRIVVTVGNRVVTQTEIMREIRITAFLNGEKPDFSAEARRKAADRLIEQKLMRNEIELSRYPAPPESEAEQLLASIRKNHPNFERELKEYNIAEEDLKNHLLWQITVLRFIELRFKPGTRVSEEEIRQEFDKRVVP